MPRAAGAPHIGMHAEAAQELLEPVRPEADATVSGPVVRGEDERDGPRLSVRRGGGGKVGEDSVVPFARRCAGELALRPRRGEGGAEHVSPRRGSRLRLAPGFPDGALRGPCVHSGPARITGDSPCVDGKSCKDNRYHWTVTYQMKIVTHVILPSS